MSKATRETTHLGNGATPPPVVDPAIEQGLFDLGLQPEVKPEPLPPATPTGTIFDDLDALALDLDADLSGATSVLSVVSVRRPAKLEFFRVHPTLRFSAALLQFEMERQSWLVPPNLLAMRISRQADSTVGGYCKQVLLTLAISSVGAVFFWPISLAGEAGAWVISARRAAIMARDKWVTIQAVKARGEYEIRAAEGEIDEPVWPDKTLSELLAMAFEGMVVDRADHPAILRMRGITSQATA